MKRNELLRQKKGKSGAACLLCVFVLIALCLALFASCDIFTTDIYLKSFQMDVTLSSDGSMTVTETAKAYFSGQDTDWFNFYRIIDDERVFNDPDVDPYSFYLDGKNIPFDGALDLDSGSTDAWKKRYESRAAGYVFARTSGLEIGVVMPQFESGTHTFQYTYTIRNVITGISDATVFYYKFVSEINTMDIKVMDVTIRFPEEEKALMSWLHVSAGAVGAWKEAEDNRSIHIHVEDVSHGEYIESRLLLSKSNYALSEINSSITSVDVENEEKSWYEAYKRKQAIRLAITIGDYVLGALFILFGVFYCFRLKKRNKPLELPNAPIYYRDIPEGYTGGEVSPLYFYYSNENYLDESISATMLELTRLKYISITPDSGSKSAKITVLKKDEDDSLRSHQKFVLEMLLLIKPMGESFTMKEFEKYGKSHAMQLMKLVQKYKEAILNKSQRENAYPKNNPIKDQTQNFASKMVVSGFVLVFFSGFTSFFLSFGAFFTAVGLIVGGLIPYFVLRKAKAPLTAQGQKEYDMLRALSRFMQEFSSMDEHEIPSLVLWEDYMIFATAMGIADKVAEQLEIKYPEFKKLSESNFDVDNFAILYFFSRSFRTLSGLNFVGNVANVIRSVETVQRAMRAAEVARKFGASGGGSGRGGGGGFHGGGGGFSGGGFGGRR